MIEECGVWLVGAEATAACGSSEPRPRQRPASFYQNEIDKFGILTYYSGND